MFNKGVSLRKVLAGASLAAAMAIASSPASADTISTADGNDAVFPIFSTAERQGFYNANLWLVGGPADIEVSYLGAEAGYQNTFNFDTLTVTTPGGGGWNTAGAGSLGTLSSVTSGLLNFSFTSPDGTVFNDPAGGNSNAVNGVVNFFVTFDPETASGGQIAWLFLDDAGAGDDDNHDDMVIRLSIVGGNACFTTNTCSPPEGSGDVPLPGAAYLFMGAVGAYGLLRRRQKRKPNTSA